MPTGSSGDDSPGVPDVELGDATASALSVAAAVAEAVGAEAAAAGGGAVVGLGLDAPAAPPTLTGEHAMIALAAMSPLASTVVEKQCEPRATSAAASIAAGMRSS
jgi:hypothetical protein